jgi:hypothetical protein
VSEKNAVEPPSSALPPPRSWLFQDEDLAATLPALLATRAGALTVAAELAALAFMSPFLLLEAGTLRAYGLRGWASIWNGVDLATYAIQLSAAAMHLSRRGVGSDALSGILAAQCVLLLFRMQYFSSVFKSTRVSFLDALRDVLAEVRAVRAAFRGAVLCFVMLLSIHLSTARRRSSHPPARPPATRPPRSAPSSSSSPLSSSPTRPPFTCSSGASRRSRAGRARPGSTRSRGRR